MAYTVYTKAGTDAAIAARAAAVYQPEAYGAVGTADDSATLQAALNAIPSTGGILNLSGRTYNIGTGLTANQAVKIVGSPGIDGSGSTINYTGTTGAAITLTHSGATVQDVSIVGAGGATRDASLVGLNVTNANYFRMRGARIQGFSTNMKVDGGVYWSVTESAFRDFTAAGLDIAYTGHADSGDMTVEGNTFDDQGLAHGATASAVLWHSSSGLRFVNNKINGTFLNGLRLDVADGASTGILLVASNSIENFTGAGISLVRTGTTGTFGLGVVITGNMVCPYNPTSGSTGVLLSVTTSNVTIAGNGISAATTGIDIDNAGHVTIAGNTLNNIQTTGIHVGSAATDVQVTAHAIGMNSGTAYVFDTPANVTLAGSVSSGTLRNLLTDASTYGCATTATAATNATALTAAWNAGKTLGLPVHVGPGTYQLNPVTLTAYDGATLTGTGAGFDDSGRMTTQLVSNAGAGVDLITINTGGASTKAWNVTLQDFEIAGTGSDGSGLRIGDLTGVIGPYTVRRVTSHNFGAAGFTMNGKLDHGYWEACVARNNPLGYDQGGAGNKFISETTYVACHGSFNTQYGWKIRSSSSATNLTGCESSSNSVAGLWIGSQSTAPHYVRVQGHHAENNTTYAVDVANSTASCTVVFDGLRVMDSSTAGIAVGINVASQFQVHVQNCYFELKNANAVGVKEAAGSYVTYGEHNLVLNFSGTNTLYLRQDPNGVLTNYRHGFAKKPADQVLNNTTTLTADTDLKVYVPPTGTYVVDLFLIYDASTAGDILTAWTAPTGATMDWASGGLSSGTTSGTTALVTNAFTIASSGASGGVNVGSKVIMRAQGLLTMSTTGGTLGLQWAQLAADATNLTVRAGSWLRLTRVD